MKLLLDTYIWLWSLLDPTRLNRRVITAVKRVDNELWLSPISVWGLIVLSERGRVKLDSAPRTWVAEALAQTPAQQAMLNFEVAVRSREILPEHADPADRFLVATALIYDLTLVTADQALIKSKPCPILVAA